MTAADIKAPPQVNIVDLATLIATTSRLLVGLAGLTPFKSANVSLAEWLALSVLADKDGVSNKQLARTLGVTGQRVNQLCTSLAKAELITIENAADDNRRNVVKITSTGRTQLGTLNSQLQLLLASALKDREKALASAGRHMRLMMRIVQVGNPEKAPKTGKKEAA